MAGEEPVVDQAAAAPAPVVEAPAAAPAAPAAAPEPQHPSEIPTLLESFKAPGSEPPKSAEPPKPDAKAPEAKPDAKPAEAAKVEAKPGEKPAEEPKAEEKPAAEEPPAEYKFEFAEHVKPDAAKVAAFTDFAREHKLSPEAAQKAISHFNEAATAFVAEQQRAQIQTWNETRKSWQNECLADPMIGGSGHKTAMGVVARMRDMAISDHQPGTPNYKKDFDAFESFLRITGAGDHPVFNKLLYRMGAKLDEPKLVTAIPKPTPTNGARPSNSLYAAKRQ